MDSSSDPNAELQTRVRQQEVVVELGQQALETDDVDQLLWDAARAVADTLDAEFSAVFEFLPAAEELLLRGGVGWRDEDASTTTVSASPDTFVGTVLRSGEPVVVGDCPSDEDAPAAELFADHDITGSIGVVVGSIENPWGVLSVHATGRRAFTERDGVFLQSVADVLASAAEREVAKRQLDEVYSRITDAVFALDADWTFTHANERARELIDPEDHGLVGETIWEAFPETVDTPFEAEYRTAMETQEPTTFEAYYPDPLNTWFEVHAYPSESGLSVYFRDITERKEYERKLEQHRALTQAANDAIVTIDEDSVIRSVNPAVEDVFGYEPEDLVGEPLTMLMPPGLSERHYRALGQYLDTGEKTLDWNRVEIPGRHRDGTDVPLAISFSEAEHAGECFFTGIIRDVTERRRYERQLEESNERLEQFAYAASHDLQEPLRMVTSYLRLVERRYAEELDDEGREFIEFAVDGADRMRDMIEGLLEYSRVESQGDPLEPVDLDDVLDDVLDDLQVRIEESDAEIAYDSLPTIDGDASQLRQVFQNLLSNAIEYSGDEPPQIDVSAGREGDEWVISVHDEGIGIDPEDADRVFEVFQRLHSQDEHAGTGIGLALCRRIVERHGGEIWVESERGAESTFSFTLPDDSSHSD